jgi:hypothetical protein
VSACTADHMYRTLSCHWRVIRLVPQRLNRHYCLSRGGVGCACDILRTSSFPFAEDEVMGFQSLHYHPVPPTCVGGLRHILCLTSLRSVSLSSAKFAFLIGLSLFLLKTPRPLYLFLSFLISWLDPCTFPCLLPPLLRFFEIRIVVFTYCFIRT